jgi:indole-3-glycerol phosphate synthase
LEDLALRIAEKGLVPLVECHTFEDVVKLDGKQWPLVGVNNRDLRTFEVDLHQSKQLAAALPAESLKVAESGLSDRQDIETLAGAGFDAFLIGESLLLSDNPGEMLKVLGGVDGR